MVWVPGDKVLTAGDRADEPVTGGGSSKGSGVTGPPRSTPSTANCTGPEGATVWPAGPDRVSRKVTDWPAADGLAEELSVSVGVTVPAAYAIPDDPTGNTPSSTNKAPTLIPISLARRDEPDMTLDSLPRTVCRGDPDRSKKLSSRIFPSRPGDNGQMS